MVVTLRGEEAVLEQLEGEWQTVALQTLWKLEPVLRYDYITPASSVEDPKESTVPTTIAKTTSTPSSHTSTQASQQPSPTSPPSPPLLLF